MFTFKGREVDIPGADKRKVEAVGDKTMAKIQGQEVTPPLQKTKVQIQAKEAELQRKLDEIESAKQVLATKCAAFQMDVHRLEQGKMEADRARLLQEKQLAERKLEIIKLQKIIDELKSVNQVSFEEQDQWFSPPFAFTVVVRALSGCLIIRCLSV